MEGKKQLLRKSNVIAFVVVFILACVACFAGLLTRSAAAEEADATEEEQAPVATLYIGSGNVNDPDNNIYYYEYFDVGWKEAINRAAAAYAVDKTAFVKVVLTRDWIADENDGFGTDTTAFSNGRIFSPANTNIVIDLNGHKIDRNLYDTDGKTNGHVLQVTGTLTVDDSVGGGKITGGHNLSASTALGGGVYISGGIFNLCGGSIERNKATSTYSTPAAMGVGVVIANVGTFNMYGGSIKDHSITASANMFGAGVCLYNAATTAAIFNMYGGRIENNEAYYGGGIATYVSSSGTTGTPIINIDGGIVCNNRAVSSAGKAAGGGAIYMNNSGELNIKSGELYGNTGEKYGGAIYFLARKYTRLNISGGNIHDNIAATYGADVYGGAIAMKKSAAADAVMTMTGGIIENNTVCSDNDYENLSSEWYASGGALYTQGVLTEIKGGEIRNNTACSFKVTNTEGDLNDTCLGKANYGGAFYVAGLSSTTSSVLKISGGNIHHNTAMSGGAIVPDTYIEITGGSLTENSAKYGGAVYLTAKSIISVAGKPIIENNYSVFSTDEKVPTNLQVASADDRKLKIAGAFEDGARINVFVNENLIDDGLPFTQGYGEHNRKFVSVDGSETNGIYVYANPYRYFVSGTVYVAEGSNIDPTRLSEQHIMVLNTGELGVARAALKFVVTYSDSSTEEFLYGDETVEKLPEWNCVECTYGDTKRPVSISAPDAPGAPSITVGEDAGVYTLSAKPGIGDTEAEFSVVVKAKELSTALVDITLSDDDFKYNGEEKIPSSCTVKYNNITLVDGTDYTLSYENNVNAGQATAVITFKGNYIGEARANYTIATNPDSITMGVAWEMRNGTEWVPFDSSAYTTTFTFDGKDQSGKLRAVITANDPAQNVSLEQTVYADGVNVTDEDRNTSMAIEFTVGADTTAVALKNAGTYAIRLVGDGNYRIEDADRIISGIVMQKQEIELAEEDFSAYEDGNGERQWMVEFELDDSTVATPLLDKVTYIDPDADANKFGEKVTVGALDDAYVRYRGTAFDVVFNGEYTLANGELLSKYLEIADSVVYTSVNKTTAANNTVGAYGQVNEIETTAVITFGNNYAVSGGNTLTLKKTWYIVTIGNNLRMSDGNEISATELTGWEFGSSDGLKGYAFRPEHGNTVIYTYYKAGSTEIIRQFALRYADDTVRAEKEFYEVKVVDDKIVIDEDQPLNDFNYHYTYNNTLKAGTYRIEISIPQLEPSAGEHTHWWNNETASDLGAVYYEYTYTFSFTIATYSISDGSAPNLGVNVRFPQATVYYNGEANNIAKPVIMLNRKLLVEGEDYELSCDQVNVGSATLKIKGINSLTGEFSLLNAFEIVKAQNVWERVPNIISWKYSDFDKEINLISAEPKFADGGMWFAIYKDSEMQRVVKGLEKITLTNGLVSDAVATALNDLPAGSYYLRAVVTDTDNFTGLDPAPLEFRVLVMNNAWTIAPNVIQWSYKGYDKNTNLILGKAVQGTVLFNVYSDAEGNKSVLDSAFVAVDDAIAAKFNNLPAGKYYLRAMVFSDENYSALDSNLIEFEVAKAPNDWTYIDVVGWQYSTFKADTNRILATTLHSDVTPIKFTIKQGDTVIAENFKEVDSTLAATLNGLEVGEYTLIAMVEDTDNYATPNATSITFEVMRAENEWVYSPSIESWISGRYDAETNMVKAQAKFGTGTIAYVIYEVGNEDNVIYDTVKGINKLADADIGLYMLTAHVEGTSNYSGIPQFMITFRVFEAPGLPWWGTLLITVGALLLAALILFILWKKGVFQILTEKIVVAIRTKASVDATIASVRAAKKAEEGKQSVAEAKRRERIEEMRRRAEEQRAMSPEERAAQLEEKAKADEERAEKLRARSEAKRQKAAKMREVTPAEEKPAEEPAAETPEAPTEE